MLSSSFSVWCHEYESLQTLKVFCSCCGSTSLSGINAETGRLWMTPALKWSQQNYINAQGVSKHLLRVKLALISSLTNMYFNKYQHRRKRQRWLFFLLEIIIWTSNYFYKTIFFRCQKEILNPVGLCFFRHPWLIFA